MTRIPEMLAHGIRIDWSQYCVREPGCPLGKVNMLDVAFYGPACGPNDQPGRDEPLLRHGDQPERCHFEPGRVRPGVGKKANLGESDAGNPIEAVRLRPERLLVMAKGKVIAKLNRQDSELVLLGRPLQVNKCHKTL